jgi:glucans biosynthesis protein
MYFYGENQHAPREDYRPAVHDSQGLQIAVSGGEWIWRPLVNPRRLLVTSFMVNSPAGFGLMQRDRDFQDYQDFSSRFELRPSAWIQPIGRWGAGHIELVELPTPDETNDNIVAYWMPAAVPPLGQPLDISYQIHWQLAHETRPPSAWVTQSRRGPGYERPGDNSVVFTVDFDGPGLRRLPADAPLQAVASADDNGQITQTQLTRNPVTEGWRVELHVRRRDDDRPVELRLYLRKQHDTISETWSYILPPE